MPNHRFTVGESVNFNQSAFYRRMSAKGEYRVTKLGFPHRGREFEYRIKSPLELTEREVRKASGG